MQTQPLGDSPLLSTRLAYGCWRVAGSEDPREVTDDSMAQGRRAIAAAYEAGYILFDNAGTCPAGVQFEKPGPYTMSASDSIPLWSIC